MYILVSFLFYKNEKLLKRQRMRVSVEDNLFPDQLFSCHTGNKTFSKGGGLLADLI